jgi:hypothetical protein
LAGQNAALACSISVPSVIIDGLNYSVGNSSGLVCLMINTFNPLFNGTIKLVAINEYLVNQSFLGVNDIFRSVSLSIYGQTVGNYSL